VAGAVGAVAVHAAARLVQVLAVFELALGRRERHLERRQLHDAVELAIGQAADDACRGRDQYDEPREAHENDLDRFFHCNPRMQRGRILCEQARAAQASF
jgi:hypothetical protein